MDPQKISYTDPVSNSFDATKRILFQPFNIGKWFALGFSAWLATLLAGGSSFQGNFNMGGAEDSPDFEGSMQSAAAWLQEHMALVIALVTAGVVIGLAFYLVMLWASSRGKFMFLDNLLHDRALVKAPWKEFKTLGHSLFLWRLIFGLGVFVVFLLYAGGAGFTIYSMVDSGAPGASVALLVIPAVLLLLLGLLVVSYIGVMLEDFVVPIMYRERISTTAAWSRFLVLHRGHFWKFVVYFLWRALLSIGTSMGLSMIGLVTCCIGFILMALPYIGAVVILPVTTFFRLLGPEFLRQFGTDYDVFPTPPPVPEAPAAPAEA